MDFNALVIIFAVACIVAVLAKYIKWPYTITLVIAGIAVAWFGFEAPFGLDRDILFHALLPPLLFEGALHMRLEHLKRNYRLILLLILPGLMFSVLFTGLMLNALFPAVPLIFTLLLAAIVIPTDPAAILAFYRDMRVPRSLKTVIEGESVFDDGLAIVLFNVIVVIIVASGVGGEVVVSSGSLLNGAAEFLWISGVGIALGYAAGYVTVHILRKIDDRFTEVMITVILAFGIFALAEKLGGSGVFAVVISGLMLGNYGTRFAMGPSTRMSLVSFWSFLAFGVNSLLFILIGMNVGIRAIADHAWIILATVLILWIARAIVIASMGAVSGRIKPKIPPKGQMMMWWGGLRGAIPIVMALSIPLFLSDGITEFPHRELILTTTFGVVLFTLLVQGLSLRAVLRSLGYADTGRKAQVEGKQAEAMTRDCSSVIAGLREDGDFMNGGHRWLTARFAEANSGLLSEIGELMSENGFVPREEYTEAVVRTLGLKRDAVKEACRKGLMTVEAAEKLMAEINAQRNSLRAEMAEHRMKRPTEMLRDMARPRKPKATGCGICNQDISAEQESDICGCGAGFHRECLGDRDRCPVCLAPLKAPEDED